MDDFSVYGNSFDKCLNNIIISCMENKLALNWEKCLFIVVQGVVLGYIISAKEIEVDKYKINLIFSLAPSISVREVCSFLGYAGFYRTFNNDILKISWPFLHITTKGRGICVQ